MEKFLQFILGVAVLFCIAVMQVSPAQAEITVNITDGDEWQYYTGEDAPPYQWNYLNYDSSGWLKGLTGFGYGTFQFRTFLGSMKGNYQTVYARREFPVNRPGSVSMITLRIHCDGPFAAFINGVEVISNTEPVDEELDISGFHELLRPGRNVVAVQCSNDDVNSDDFSFIPSLTIYQN